MPAVEEIFRNPLAAFAVGLAFFICFYASAWSLVPEEPVQSAQPSVRTIELCQEMCRDMDPVVEPWPENPVVQWKCLCDPGC